MSLCVFESSACRSGNLHFCLVCSSLCCVLMCLLSSLALLLQEKMLDAEYVKTPLRRLVVETQNGYKVTDLMDGVRRVVCVYHMTGLFMSS